MATEVAAGCARDARRRCATVLLGGALLTVRAGWRWRSIELLSRPRLETIELAPEVRVGRHMLAHGRQRAVIAGDDLYDETHMLGRGEVD